MMQFLDSHRRAANARGDWRAVAARRVSDVNSVARAKVAEWDSASLVVEADGRVGDLHQLGHFRRMLEDELVLLQVNRRDDEELVSASRPRLRVVFGLQPARRKKNQRQG